MKKVLFVDDEPDVLRGLRRMLRAMRDEWEMYFVESGPEALALLEQDHFDVIVSDMRMPGMNGAELFARVREKYPHMIRIILSGFSDQSLLSKAARHSHQFLTKPCDSETLKKSVKRVSDLQDILSGERVKSIIAQTDSLPSLPFLYNKIIQKLQEKDVSIAEIGGIIEQDISMTAQILKLVNSSFFGFFKNIANPVQAASLLGIDTIKTLVLSIEIFSILKTDSGHRFPFEKLWERSTLCAGFAKLIAGQVSKDKQFIDDAFSAAFLMDIGILLLASKLPQEYNRVLSHAEQNKYPLFRAERQVLESSHAEIGAYLLGLWGFPENIVEAVARHHKPDIFGDEPQSLITVLHLSDVFVERIFKMSANLYLGNKDEKYLSELNLDEKSQEWFTMCEKMYRNEGVDG